MIATFEYATLIDLWEKDQKIQRTIPARSFIQIESVGIASLGTIIMNLGVGSAFVDNHSGNINFYSGNLPAVLSDYTEFDIFANNLRKG